LLDKPFLCYIYGINFRNGINLEKCASLTRESIYFF
jgi:hypothetical protein